MDPTSKEHIVKATCREKKVYLNIKTVLSTGNSPESKLSWFVSVCLFPSSQRFLNLCLRAGSSR